MGTVTITEFLLARIDEDEAVARAAIRSGDGTWTAGEQFDVDGEVYDRCAVFGDDLHIYDEGGHDENHAAHIARHDPARVLAECAAKRAIIEQHKDWPVLVEKKPEFSEHATDIQGMTMRVSQEMAWLTEREYVKHFGTEAPTTNMILALAAVYASHPDYRQEWA